MCDLDLLDVEDDLLPLGDPAEHRVLVVQVWRRCRRDEELRPIRVGA